MAPPDRVRILGIPIDRVSMAGAVTEAQRLIAAGGGARLVGVCNTYTAVVAQRDARLRAFYEAAALNLPDGMPLVWTSRLYGRPIPERVSGPDFLLELARAGVASGLRHFFLGAAPGVADAMAEGLRRDVPGLAVAGAYAPPYGAFSEEDNRRMADAVNGARTDVLWVGMSAPKQETWLLEMAPRLKIGIGVGVGAAFDFFAGRVRRAPAWMRGAGLEWAFRLAMEPRRLWKRYLYGNTAYCAGIAAEVLSGRHRLQQSPLAAVGSKSSEWIQRYFRSQKPHLNPDLDSISGRMARALLDGLVRVNQIPRDHPIWKQTNFEPTMGRVYEYYDLCIQGHETSPADLWLGIAISTDRGKLEADLWKRLRANDPNFDPRWLVDAALYGQLSSGWETEAPLAHVLIECDLVDVGTRYLEQLKLSDDAVQSQWAQTVLTHLQGKRGD